MRFRFAACVFAVGLPVASLGLASPAFAVPSPDNTCTVTHNSDTGNGANTSGVYDSNCIPALSGNGNGGGNATGQPLAGTVGNADDKNPKGQLPNALDDGNNGYECDGNKGIAQTNPAHTGCTPVKPPCPKG